MKHKRSKKQGYIAIPNKNEKRDKDGNKQGGKEETETEQDFIKNTK